MPATLPVWKANGTAVSGTAGITVNAPTGHAVGDFLVLAVNSSNQAISTPSGWNTVNNGNGTGTAGAADSVALGVFWKRAATTTENAVIADTGDHTLGVITSFTGVSLDAAPIETLAASAKLTNSTTDTFPTITTVGPNRLVVAVVSTGQESVKSAPTFAGLGSFTARGVGVTTSGVDGGIAMFSGTKVAAGATGTGTVTESIASKSITLTFALKPANFEQTIVVTGGIYGGAMGVPQVNGGAVTVYTPNPGAINAGFAASFQMYAGGGNNVFTWTLISGSVAGMSLATNGVYSGTPTTAGTYSVTVRATDGLSAFDEHTFDIVVGSFGVDDVFEIVTWTGTGTSTRTITTLIDLSGGGLVMISARQAVNSNLYNRAGIYMSPAGGTTSYFKKGDVYYQSYATASSVSFANGSFSIDDVDMNVNGLAYIALVLRKHTTTCDVVAYTGDGTANRKIAHNLGVTPSFVGDCFLRRPAWVTGYSNNVAFIVDNYQTQANLGGAIWGTDATPHTSTQFSVGVVTFMGDSVNTNGSQFCMVLIPSDSPFIKIGVQGGTAGSLAVDPGWSADTVIRPGSIPRFFSEFLSGANFPGTDNSIVYTRGEETPDGDSISTTGTVTTYTFVPANTPMLLIRRAGSGGAIISPTGIASGQAFGSPTVTRSGLDVQLHTTSMYLTKRSSGAQLVAVQTDTNFPVTFSHVGGTLPNGVTLVQTSPTEARLYGTPTAAGSASGIVIRAVNGSYSLDTTVAFTIYAAVDAPPSLAGRFESFEYTGVSGATSGFKTIPLTVDITAGGTVLVVGEGVPANGTPGFRFIKHGGTLYRADSGGNAVDTAITGESVTSNSLTFSLSTGEKGQNCDEIGKRYRVVVHKVEALFFDIVTWVPTAGGGNLTVPHALGSTPEAIVMTNSHYTYHRGFPVQTFLQPEQGAYAASGRSVINGFTPGTYNSTPSSTNIFLSNNMNDSTGGWISAGRRFMLVIGRGVADGQPDHRAVVRVGTYTGTGALTNRNAVVPGWPIQQMYLHGPMAGVENGLFVNTRTSPTWHGDDEFWEMRFPSALLNFLDDRVDGVLLRPVPSTDTQHLNTLNATPYDYIAYRRDFPAAQTVTPVGIASGQAFGSPTVSSGAANQNVSVTGIASAQAFGSPTVLRGNVTRQVTGIASAQAFGSPTVLRGGVTRQVSGIASGQAMGSPTVLRGGVTRQVTGIASGQAFGVPTVIRAQFVSLTGIPSGQAFGTPTVIRAQFVSLTGIPSAQAFGSPTIVAGAGTVALIGIPSGQVFGTPTVLRGNVTRPVNGIPSAQAFGTPTVLRGGVVRPVASIPSGQAFGVPTVIRAQFVSPTGIPSAQAFGTPTVLRGNVTVLVDGIPSGQAFGTPTVLRGNVTVSVDGIPSGQAFGVPTIKDIQSISPAGIASAQAFGVPTVLVGAVTVSLDGIPSGQAFGVPSFVQAGANQEVDVTGISSGQAFGAPTVLPGPVQVLIDSIQSAQEFGDVTVLRGGVERPVASIPSGQAFGVPTVVVGGVTVSVDGIPSAGEVGSVTIFTQTYIQLTGIPSAQAFGQPVVLPGPVTVSLTGIASGQAFGVIFIGGGARDIANEVFYRPRLSTTARRDNNNETAVERPNENTVALRITSSTTTARRPSDD